MGTRQSMAVVQQIIRQARTTFRKSRSDPTFLQEFENLKALMNTLTPEDLQITPAVAEKSWDHPPYVIDSPSCCMEVFECPEFSVGIFILKPKTTMPLHDHPGMHGILKVLFGSLTLTAYTLPVNHNTQRPPFHCPPAFSGLILPDSEPCVVHPDDSNVHEIKANDEPVAFLDVLAPPYDPSSGRDCTYYFRETPTDKSTEEDDDDGSVWLNPGPHPSWWACVPVKYSGSRV